MNVRVDLRRESSTRQEILILLKKNGFMTVQDLSHELGLTGMAIRRHLFALQKERYIQIAFQRREARKPTSVYRLSSLADQLFPNHYDVLAIDILNSIQSAFGDDFVEELFVKRKKTLEHKYRAMIPNQSLERRITAFAQIQDAEGFMVKFKMNADGTYLFEEGNCPISQIAIRHHQVCACELVLFSEVLDAHVERTECMAAGGRNVRI